MPLARPPRPVSDVFPPVRQQIYLRRSPAETMQCSRIGLLNSYFRLLRDSQPDLVTDFDDQLVRLEPEPIQRFVAHRVIVDDDEISHRPEGPAKARV